MNNLDQQYQELLQDILDNGVTKADRTGTGTISVFGRQIRHKMSEGFPLLTTKKMSFKTISTELLWFLRGDTNIKYLVDNGCNIWNGDAYKRFTYYTDEETSMERFIELIKTDDEFAKKWGELGPIYGKQWRSWSTNSVNIDQIHDLINDLKTNPDSRRLMVSAWNVGELDSMILPPCHYGFQVYTKMLSPLEIVEQAKKDGLWRDEIPEGMTLTQLQKDFKTRTLSLMWNQRSVDTFLGLPFNIASYGLLLEIIAEMVNMVPDELIGNLGDTHLYLNHIDQAKEQIGRDFTRKEQVRWVIENTGVETNVYEIAKDIAPKRTRQSFLLPRLNINTEFWPTESSECGVGPLDTTAVLNAFKNDDFCKCLLEEDLQLSNYQSHSAIKAPLSN